MAVTTPKQARARETFDHILDAVAELLVEKGIEGLTTNEAASRAGINISTLYRYFDDKYDLVEGLLKRFTEVQLARVAEKMPQFDDPAERLDHIIDLQLELREQHPWLTPLQHALKASPRLESIARENKAQVGSIVLGNAGAGGANARGPFTLGERRDAAMQLSIEIWNTGLQTIASAPASEREALTREFKILLNAYLDTMAPANK